MKKVTLYFMLYFLFIVIQVKAQENSSTPVQTDVISGGIGIGQDYGGFGLNLIAYPQRNIGIFGGVGYNLAGAGYNVGLKFRLISKKPTGKVNPYAVVMYGYNAVIMVTDASQYDKVFYGPTAGIGIDLKTHPRSKIYYSFGLNIPFRGSEVDDYMNDLKNNHSVEFKNDLFPVTFSIGFKYIFK
jgi:hypothetical protein